MKRAVKALALGLLWVLAVVLTALDALLAWCWLRGTLYVMEYGRAENPYAAEDAEIAGFCALVLLPLALAALAWAVYATILWCKKRAEARSER